MIIHVCVCVCVCVCLCVCVCYNVNLVFFYNRRYGYKGHPSLLYKMPASLVTEKIEEGVICQGPLDLVSARFCVCVCSNFCCCCCLKHTTYSLSNNIYYSLEVYFIYDIAVLNQWRVSA